MSITDDLSSLFGATGNGTTVRQGKVVSWNSSTGENAIALNGVTVTNVPLLVAESTVLQPGDAVAILSDGDQAFLLGKVTEPGEPDTVPTWSADITTLNDVTVPGVAATAAAAQTTASSAQADATAAAATAGAAADAAAQAAADALAAAQVAADAAADAAAALAKFPITETDITPGSITTPLLAANAINGMIITGTEIRTAATGQRIALNDPAYLNQIGLYSGNSNEVAPALILPILGGANYGLLEMRSPDLTGAGGGYCWIDLEGYADGHSSLEAQADNWRAIGGTFIELLSNDIRLTDGSDTFAFSGLDITADGDATLTAPSFNVVGVLKQNGVAVMPGDTPVATLAGTQTLTNKTLTAPVLNAADLNGATQFGGGTAISQIRYGGVTATTNATGQIVVTHNMGATPNALFFGHTGHLIRAQAWNSTTFTVECRVAGTNAVAASTSVSFFWLAIIT